MSPAAVAAAAVAAADGARTFGCLAPVLAANGFRPVPVHPGKKNPIPEGWPGYAFTDGDEQRWSAASVGLLTGEVVAVDIDVLNRKLANQVADIVIRHLGSAPVRIGRWPKRLIIYRTSKPFNKKTTRGYRLPEDAGDAKAHKVEILATGQQFVAFGVHPDTGAAYEWLESGNPLTVPAGSLQEITEAEADALIADIESLLNEHGTASGRLRVQDSDPDEHVPNKRLRADDPDALRDAFSSIPNPDLEYDDWIYIGMALKAAIGDDGYDAFDEWSALSKKYDAAQTTTAWASFKPTRIGAGTIFRFAQRNGWQGPTSSAKPEDLNYQFMINYPPRIVEAAVSVPAPVAAAPSLPPTNADATARAFGAVAAPKVVVPLFDLADASAKRFLYVPPRPRTWLLKDYLPAGIVGSVIAPGGTGKSQLILQLAASVSAGVPFCETWLTGAQGPVLALLAEDDEDEIHRRLSHIARHMNATHKDCDIRAALSQNLYVRSMVAQNNLLTSVGAARNVSDTGYADRIIATVAQLQNAKLVVLDPASRFRGGDENSAEDVTRFIEVLERIRKATNATVIIVHHANKASMQGGEQTQAASRGSSAFSDGIRWQMNLATLTESEAKSFSIASDDRRHYLSATMTKNNYAPPQPTVYLKRSDGGVLVPAPLSEVAAGKSQRTITRILETVAGEEQMSARRFAEAFGGRTGRFGIGEKALRGYVDQAITMGLLTKGTDGKERPLIVTPTGQAALDVLARTKAGK